MVFNLAQIMMDLLKVQPSADEMRLSVGRNTTWGGFMTFYADSVNQLTINSNGITMRKFNLSGGLSSQYLMGDGSTKTGGLITGVTSNYILKATSTATAGNSIIYDNTTGIGIGTATVHGAIQLNTGNILLGARRNATTTFIGLDNGSGTLANTAGIAFKGNGSSSSFIDFITENSGGGVRMRIDSVGNVGIGDTVNAGGDKLRVNGTVNISGNVSLATAGNKIKITEGTNGSAGPVFLVSGTKAITISGVTTSTRAFCQFVSIGGTVTTTWQYAAVCTSNTLTITALTNAGATNTSDTSTLNYWIEN